MTIEFQKDLLKVLIQQTTFKRYISQINEDIFELPEHQVIFQLLQKYLEKFKKQPEYGSMLEWWDRLSKKQKLEDSIYKNIQVEIGGLYIPYIGDIGLLEESLSEQIQYQMAKKLFQKYASQLNEGIETYRKMRIELNDIIEFDKHSSEELKGKYLWKDFTLPKRGTRFGNPTFLHGLNKMTSAGGFYSPQLVVIMGGPKGFKTGMLINLCLNYAIDGLKVFYADTENGLNSIENRFKQAQLECNYQELFSGDLDNVLEEQSGRMQVMGGEVRIERFPANTKTIADLEIRLEELKEEDGWVPDVICYDYLDLFLSVDPTKRKDKRLNIQAVYFDAINLQDKLGCFGLTVSQVNKNAVNKPIINMTDFAEDFGKAMNAHAAFAICRTVEEQENGVARLVPVMQREGVAQSSGATCLIKIDESKMSVKEITYEDYVDITGETAVKTDSDKPRKRKTALDRKAITDD